VVRDDPTADDKDTRLMGTMTRKLEAMMIKGRDMLHAGSCHCLAANSFFSSGALLCSAPHNDVLCED